MVEFKSGRPLAASPALWRRGALAMACGLTLFLGACAHNGGAAPGLQWQFNAAGEAVPDAAVSAAADPSSSSDCGQADSSGWNTHCYVYRGGRDPKTGLAYTQL